MDTLIVGADKSPILEYAKPCKGDVLLLDDGPLIDQFQPRKSVAHKVTHFDVERHHINPMEGMDDVRAEEFMAVMDARFPEGKDTLRRMDSNYILFKALMNNPTYLDELIAEPNKKDAAALDAYQKIDRLMMSPVLKAVLCKRIEPFALRGIVLVRLDRAKLGDWNCFILGNFLISKFKGQVILPHGEFYLRDHHIALIRQDRLVAGVNRLSSLSDNLRDELLAIPDKIASRANYDDAVELAKYEGVMPHTDGHDTSLKKAMGLL